MEASVFDTVSEGLEARTDLERIQARGTVRIALKAAGLDVRAVTPDQMAVVLAKVLPAELEQRGVAEAGRICAELGAALDGAATPAPRGDSPEDVFERLGGGRSSC